MADEDVRIAATIFAEPGPVAEPTFDMVAVIEDEERWSRNRELFQPDATIKFVTPGEGVTVMQQEFTGIEGLRTGWRNWLDPWESYRIETEEVIDAGEGRILILVTSKARMRGTGAEVPQSAASLFFVEDGRIAGINFYLDQAQARRDAGLA
jgi:ketosteroid isomerase-like protein